MSRIKQNKHGRGRDRVAALLRELCSHWPSAQSLLREWQARLVVNVHLLTDSVVKQVFRIGYTFYYCVLLGIRIFIFISNYPSQFNFQLVSFSEYQIEIPCRTVCFQMHTIRSTAADFVLATVCT